MRTEITAICFAIGVLIGVATVGQGADVRVGGVAPDFTATDAEGKSVKLSSLRGKKVVLIFTRAHW